MYISFATTDCSVNTTLRSWPNVGCTGFPTQLPLPAADYGVCALHPSWRAIVGVAHMYAGIEC